MHATASLQVPVEIWIHVFKLALGDDFFESKPPCDMNHFVEPEKSSGYQFWPQPDTPPAHLTDANALSLVCKAWYDIITPNLYSTLWVKNTVPSKESLGRVLSGPGSMTRTLGDYVHHLHIRAPAEPHAVYEILAVLPNLESLVYEDLPIDVPEYKSSIDWDHDEESGSGDSEGDDPGEEDVGDGGSDDEADKATGTDDEDDGDGGLEGRDPNLAKTPESFGTIIPGAFPEGITIALSQLKTVFWGNNNVNFRPEWNSFLRSVILQNPSIQTLGIRCWLPGLFQEHNFSDNDRTTHPVIFPSLTTLCSLEEKFEDSNVRMSRFSPGLLRDADFPCLENIIISPQTFSGSCVFSQVEQTFLGMLARRIRTLEIGDHSGRTAHALWRESFPSFTRLEEFRYIFHRWGPLSIDVGMPSLSTLQIQLPDVGPDAFEYFDKMLANDLSLFLDREHFPVLAKVVFTGPEESLENLAQLSHSATLAVMRERAWCSFQYSQRRVVDVHLA
ncbi:hypothetical protein HGRIS_007561 [Hohenbuehelia grisea]|uniref:F-box domain-containing protein n=1 Tax=Hohenbuehelia grisea TaxID=104357 RepID=A0ABR3J5L4_9AGAR